MRSRTFPMMNMGMALLITIFVVLCLVTFAALSLVSARNDQGNSEKLAEATTAYYDSTNRAYETVNQIEAALEQSGRSETDWSSVKKSLPEGVTFTEKDRTAAFSVPINERKTLEVRLMLLEKKSGGKRVRVLEMKEAAQQSWQGDDHLPVMKNAG